MGEVGVCQWCGASMQVRYMQLWDAQWECRAVWKCAERSRRTRAATEGETQG